MSSFLLLSPLLEPSLLFFLLSVRSLLGAVAVTPPKKKKIQEGNKYQPYNVDLRNKVSFNIQTTNPQADITATGHCEYWITTIDLMEYQEKSTLSSLDDTMLSEVYTVAYIYNVDGKCKGMLTPKRLNILQKAFNRAKCSGLHDHVQPPLMSFASELVGLIARKDISAS